MKKTLYSIAALSLAFFASCAEDSFNAAPQMGDAITFQINEDLVTRGTPITKKNIVEEMGTMNVVVRDNNGKNPFSDDNTTLTLSGGESGLTGSISPNRYWSANMGADDQYHFFVAPQGIELDPSYADGKFSFTYTQPNNYESDGVDGKDLIVAASSASKGEAVGITFRHALTAVKVIYDKPINAHDIASITVWEAIASATCTYNGETFDWNITGAKTTNLTQDVNHQIVSSEGELVGTEESTFMLIPGGKLNLSVEIDGKDYYLTEDTDIDLVAGQTVVINITDEAKKTEGSGSNKVITYDEATDTYSITIDAWVTGEVKTETVSVPMDLVVLLDLSGSMDQSFSGEDTYSLDPKSTEYTNKNIDGKYYKDGDEYCKISLGTTSDNKYYAMFTKGGKEYYLQDSKPVDSLEKLYADGEKIFSNSSEKIYTRITAGTSKLNATKLALNSLIENVKQDAAKNNVEHRISIVKFADDSFYAPRAYRRFFFWNIPWGYGDPDKTHIGDDFTGSYNRSEIVTDFITVNQSGVSSLENTVESLKAGGATAVDYGMDCAEVMFGKTRSDASKVLVMLTDGEPNHQSGFDQTVANAAISKANSLKSAGVDIWSIYAGGTEPSNDVDNYMTSMASNADQYKYASDPNELNAIFETISSSIGGATADLGTETTISDAMSSVFTLPAGLTQKNVKDYVKCYEIDFAGYNGKTAFWDEDSSKDITEEMTITVNDNTFEVKGFDFTSNYCAVDSTTKKPRGKKLQIVISGLKYSGEGDLTNMAGSGIYDAQGNLVNEFTPAPLQ